MRVGILLFAVVAGCSSGSKEVHFFWSKDSEWAFTAVASAEETCRNECTKDVNHDSSQCGEDTCDTHQHTKGEWALSKAVSDADVRSSMDALVSSFMEEVSRALPPSVPSGVDAAKLLGEVRARIQEEAARQTSGLADELRKEFLEFCTTNVRKGFEMPCNTTAKRRWEVTLTASVFVSVTVELRGPADRPGISPSVSVKPFVYGSLDPAKFDPTQLGPCPCRAKK